MSPFEVSVKPGSAQLCCLMAGLLSACGTTGPSSSSGYRVTLPVLTLPPKIHECEIRNTTTGVTQPAECVTRLKQDDDAIIRELKAACLALGGSDLECQTVPTEEPL